MHTHNPHQTCGENIGCGDHPLACSAPTTHDHAGHTHSGGHHHHASSTRAMTIALLITLSLLVVEVIGGLLSGSLALLADAGHMLTDVAALSLSVGAAWLMRRPATAQRTFGYYRAEILAALFNGVSLIVIALGIGYEAIERLQAPPTVASGPLLLVATLGLIANVLSGIVLMRSGGDNLNVRSAYLHVVGDALGSVGAIAAGLLISFFGWYRADPLLSLAIAVLIVWGAWRLLRDTVNVLLEAAPASLDVAAIQRALGSAPGVANVHDLHVWSVASNFVALSGHIRLEHAPNCADHQQVLVDLRHLLKTRFGIEHATLQLEEPQFSDASSNIHEHTLIGR